MWSVGGWCTNLTASQPLTSSGIYPASCRAREAQEGNPVCWCSHLGKTTCWAAASAAQKFPRRAELNFNFFFHHTTEIYILASVLSERTQKVPSSSDTPMFWISSRLCSSILTQLSEQVSPLVLSLPVWSHWLLAWSTGDIFLDICTFLQSTALCCYWCNVLNYS